MHLELSIDHLFFTMHTPPHLISWHPCLHTVPFSSIRLPLYDFLIKGKEICSLCFITPTLKENTF